MDDEVRKLRDMQDAIWALTVSHAAISEIVFTFSPYAKDEYIQKMREYIAGAQRRGSAREERALKYILLQATDPTA
jgi:hypothetical protein